MTIFLLRNENDLGMELQNIVSLPCKFEEIIFKKFYTYPARILKLNKKKMKCTSHLLQKRFQTQVIHII